MTRFFQNPKLLLSLRILIGLLFVYSGFIKLIYPIEYFEASISRYQIIPNDMITVVAHIVPWIEFLFGFQILIGLNQRICSWVLFILTLGFSIILSQAIIRGLDINDCGCFGSSFIKLSLIQSFVLDCFMAMSLLKFTSRKTSLWGVDFIFQHKQ